MGGIIRCPFCRANRLAALRAKRQRVLGHSNSRCSLLSVLPSESPSALRAKRQRFAPSPTAPLSVLPSESPLGFSGKKASLRSVAFGSAVRFALRIASRLFGQKGTAVINCSIHYNIASILFLYVSYDAINASFFNIIRSVNYNVQACRSTFQ